MKNIKTMALHVYLLESRNRAGFSLEQVAEKLGYSTPQFIVKWEQGVASPPLNTLFQLINIYKLDSDEVFEIILSNTLSGK